MDVKMDVARRGVFYLPIFALVSDESWADPAPLHPQCLTSL